MTATEFTIKNGNNLVVSRFNKTQDMWVSRLLINNGAEAEDCLKLKQHTTEKAARNWAAKMLKGLS